MYLKVIQYIVVKIYIEAKIAEVVKIQYKESYNCAKQIKSFIEENYTYKVNDDEILYLILHINRVVSVINFNK